MSFLKTALVHEEGKETNDLKPNIRDGGLCLLKLLSRLAVKQARQTLGMSEGCLGEAPFEAAHS